MTNYRRAKGGTTYFFTVVTHERRKILCGDESRIALRASVDDVRSTHPFEVAAWVLLPDHLHCIWTLPEGDADFSTRWALLKRGFTQRVQDRLPSVEVCGSREKKRERGVWQRRFWVHLIRDERDFASHCDYIHWNPVKHGLAPSPAQWPWSTFQRFVARGMYPANWGSTPTVFGRIVGPD